MASYQYKISIFFILVLALQCCQSKQSDIKVKKDYTNSLFSKLYNTSNLHITIETDVEQIIKNKSLDGNHYQSAVLSCENDKVSIIKGEISVRPRGITRKSKCSFPPLMLKADSLQEANLNLGPSKNVKLVTYCKDSLGYPSWIIKEYLVYKVYNEFSPHSFNVKLAEIRIVDNKGTFPTIEQSGFIIEPLDELASRVNCRVIEDSESIQRVHREKYKTLTMFQYMVGNTDWNFTKRHNVRLLECDPQHGPIPVPYDFDFSGIVNANYAKPHPMLPINSVRDRLFQWRGSEDEDFSEIAMVFNNKKGVTEDIFNAPELSKKYNIAEVENYLNEFYQNIDNPEFIKKEILKARNK